MVTPLTTYGQSNKIRGFIYLITWFGRQPDPNGQDFLFLTPLDQTERHNPNTIIDIPSPDIPGEPLMDWNLGYSVTYR
jgi:hypothetical protein